MPREETVGPVFVRLADAIRGIHGSRRLLAVVLISAFGFALSVSGSWNATPDSALYLSLGESLAAQEGYSFNGEPHTLVPPGYPSILAVAARLFGPHFVVYRTLMAVLAFLTAVAAYALLARYCGKDVAFLAGGLFFLNHVLVHNSTLFLADIPCALFTFLGLNVLVWSQSGRSAVWRLALAGVVVAAVPLIRINGLGVPLAGAIYVLCSCRARSRGRALFLAVFFLVAALVPWMIWQLWKSSAPASFGEGSYFNAISQRGALTQLGVVANALWGYFAETSYALSGLVIRTGVLELILPVVTAVGVAIALRRGERLLAPLVLIQYGGLALSSAGSRYLILLIPCLYVFLAMGALEIGERLRKRYGWRVRDGRIVVGLFVLMALFNVGHNLKTVYQARSSLEYGGAESARSLPFFEAAKWLNRNDPGAPVITVRSRVIHYLTGSRTTPLIRSGVPESQTHVDSVNALEELLAHKKPQYYFADTKGAELHESVVKAARKSKLKLVEIKGIDPSGRYKLYKIESLTTRR